MAQNDRPVTRTRRRLGGAEAEAVRVWLLGGFRVSVGSRAVGDGRWRRKRAAGLVKLLALAPYHRMHRERVMDLLWPDLDPRSASNNLHRALHAARHALDPHAPAADSRYLRIRDEQIELCREGSLWVDAEVFEEVATAARRSREPAAYAAAADLYAGELLPGDLYEAWAEERRESLRQTYHSLLCEMARLHEERGDHVRAMEALRKVVDEDRAHEGAHAALMRLYAITGRRREALLQYERLRKVLLTELGAEPDDAVQRLHGEIRAGKPLSDPSPHTGHGPGVAGGGAPGNLPTPLTSFVGRGREMLEVKRSLSMTRLLTLTGTGGAGKTRLALEVARELGGAYPEGAWLVELAPLSDPALVPRATAAALGVREQPGRPLTRTLCDSLGSGRALLVLDNCEHLIDAAARLARELLSSCPGLKVLATSREPLEVAGETVWPVPTLSLPGPEAGIRVEELMRCEAVRLFVDRARSRLPAFGLTPENARAVAAICRELDGIPLAIELSTARMGALAVEKVAERLEDSLKLLTGGDRTVAPRHQTLRATLDWSYELLDEAERRLFGRLSVFAGGWTLEAAESVGAGAGIEEGDVMDLLSRLVNKSMVVVEADAASAGGLRYGMLEPVRQYGQERLEASGEAGAVRRRHASWYFELAQEVEPWLRGDHQEVWLEQLEREYGNLRVALDWALESGASDLGLWFGAALAEFWYMSGNLSEARRWLEAALANVHATSPTPARARALARAGWIAWEQGDYERSVDLSEESLALSRGLEDVAGIVAAASSLGWVALLRNDLERASALAEQALTLGRAMGDTGGVARALLVPGLAAVVRGDHERAMALHEESLTLAREAGDSLTVALSLGMGVFASLGRGDPQQARTLCTEGFAASPQPPVMAVNGFLLHAAAALAGSEGRPARSARLWGAAESLRETIGAMLSPVEIHVYGPYIEAARGRLGTETWEEAWAEGRAMGVEAAMGYALSEEDEERRVKPRRPAAPRGPQTVGPEVLSARQQEVALLVARGLTNAQIADALTISKNTVANHVAGIIKKLDLPSRSLIAVWVTERRLHETE